MFIRRFLVDPGDDVLLEIESVNILDLNPPASISGIGTGTCIIAAEFENGPYNSVVELLSGDDLKNTFGSLGYTYQGVVGNYPCAVQRSADATLTPETWNGNGFVQLSGKKFARLLAVRADTSVGAVQFTRHASVTGVGQFSYMLQPGQHLDLDLNDPATNYVTTFTATAATVTAIGGVYPTTFAGGESLTLGYDNGTDFTVFFQAADQSNAQVVARINTFAGFAFADLNAGQLRLTGRQLGNAAAVRVVSGSAGVLTKLGLTAATTIGTGNVGDILAVTNNELAAAVNTTLTGKGFLEFDTNGNPRIVLTDSTNPPFFVHVLASTTATGLGFTIDQVGTDDGRGVLIGPTTGVYATTFGGGETITIVDSALPAPVVVTFVIGDQSHAQVISRINTFFSTPVAFSHTSTGIALRSTKVGGTIKILAVSVPLVTTATALAPGMSGTGVVPTAGVIPAGTLVQNVPAAGVTPTLLVTTQDVQISSQSIGPYTAKVRHAVDDGTGTSLNAGTVTKVDAPVTFSAFVAVNPAPISAALTEAQIDAAYVNALASTLDLNSVAQQANMIYSARQSNTIRNALRQNALDASAKGMFGRVACIRPPLNTLIATATSNAAAPGVGATRDQRVIYCYPGFNTFVPLIGQRGTAGGTGFTADGNVDVGADGFMCSIMSQLPPEENPGQETTFTAAVNGLETGANVQGFDINSYKLLKASGIAGARIDGIAIFQSGVTSVDPGVYPELTRISRRRMADFIQDSVARSVKAFGKKLSTNARRRAIAGQIRSFMEGLLGVSNPGSQRIAGFTIDDKKANTPETLGRGLYKIILRVRTLASLDSIVIATTVGEQVEVDEVLPQAA
jgi:hypothetical protein